ncbi:MAG TPA: gamma-glutamyl-gamma-aminobutyrate hydrolase family protein [Candidatus Acidoferrales bacterium]|jgi:putative glutamine amidotransferase|nr:gamma-glutamyl-gamma-aminobutyrate hydrolase family protein [Candidatus Acidoferrales bacterium]
MSPEANPKPRVGVPYRTRKEELTGDFEKIEPYIKAVNAAGGMPVPISLGLSAQHLERIAWTLDGILLTGSPADIEPSLFGATKHAETAAADLHRQHTDFALIEHALSEHKPLLAICYGIQSLNVFLGGTLVQDVPSELGMQIQHDWDCDTGEPEPFHRVRLEVGSRLAQAAGASEAVVNSSHHQSVLEPGRDLRIVSRAIDGVVEAVEWANDANSVLGVQWHPERMAETDPFAQALFRNLVTAAATRKAPARI